jgi:hypothetical protein
LALWFWLLVFGEIKTSPSSQPNQKPKTNNQKPAATDNQQRTTGNQQRTTSNA